MESIQNKFNGNAGKYTLGAVGLMASPKILQDIFKQGGLKGNLMENIDTFVRSNGGIMQGVKDVVEETITGKPNFYSKLAKNKYAKIALVAALPITTTLAGVALGHSIDKANSKSIK